MAKYWIEIIDNYSIETEHKNFRSEKFSENKVKWIQKLLLEKFKSDPVKIEKFVMGAILNHKDMLGNTVLHLAAWNGKTEMYSLLINLGADPCSLNNDGLTAFTLSARFGLWDMFHHIWKCHFSNRLWSFGSVVANEVDYMQFESISNGLTSFMSVREIEICSDALADHYIENYDCDKVEKGLGNSTWLVIEKKLISLCEESLIEYIRSNLKDGEQPSSKGGKQPDSDEREIPSRTPPLPHLSRVPSLHP